MLLDRSEPDTSATPPLVSVVVPVGNRADLLRETLCSVRAQTLDRWECVVIDDASKDNASAVAAEAASVDHRVRLIRHDTPQGAPACRNRGLVETRGELVLFLDGDDTLDPTCLSRRFDRLNDHPELDAVVSTAHRLGRRDVNLFGPRGDELYQFACLCWPWQTTGPIYRRTFLERVGDWDESLTTGQDIDLAVRSLASGMRFDWLDGPDYAYRMNDDGVGSTACEPSQFEAQRRRIATITRLLGNHRDVRLQRAAVGNMLWLAQQMTMAGLVESADEYWRSAAELPACTRSVRWWGRRLLAATRRRAAWAVAPAVMSGLPEGMLLLHGRSRPPARDGRWRPAHAPVQPPARDFRRSCDAGAWLRAMAMAAGSRVMPNTVASIQSGRAARRAARKEQMSV